MKSRFIVMTGASIFALCFCGCLMYNALWHIRLHYSETPMLIYKDLGVTATEWGTQLVHLVEFDLSSSALTSVVCAVNGETTVLCDKISNPSGIKFGADECQRFVAGGVAWEISLIRNISNDCCIAWVNNCSSDTIIHMRMNEVEFSLPCEESDFVNKLGTNYCKTIVRGML